jgi:hypothetical protein
MPIFCIFWKKRECAKEKINELKQTVRTKILRGIIDFQEGLPT